MIDCSHTTQDKQSTIFLPNHTVSKQKLGCLFIRFFTRIKDEAYRELKLNVIRKRKNINLPLINKLSKRNLEIGFKAIQEFYISKTQNKMYNRITLRRNPQVIMSVCSSWYIKTQEKGFKALKQYNSTINITKNFIPILSIILKKLAKDRVKQGFNKIYQQAQKTKLQKNILLEIQRIQKKALRRLKQHSLKAIIQSVLKGKVIKSFELKKNKLKQAVDARTNSIKNVSNLREQVKLLQNSVTQQNYQANNSKLVAKKETKTNIIRLEEQIKKIKQEIPHHEQQSIILAEKLLQIQFYTKRRSSSKNNSVNSQNKMKSIYQAVANHPDSQFRYFTMLKPYTNLSLPIQQVDQFHIYQNLKIKQLVRLYENNKFTVITAQYQRSRSQNQNLKQYIKLLNRKSFEPISYFKNTLQQD